MCGIGITYQDYPTCVTVSVTTYSIKNITTAATAVGATAGTTAAATTRTIAAEAKAAVATCVFDVSMV